MTNTNSTKDPFFIFYDSRSGSTYLAKCLVENANVCIPPEANFVTSIIKSYGVKAIKTERDIKLLCDIIGDDCKFIDWNIKLEDIFSKSKKQLKRNKELYLREFFFYILELFSEQLPRREDCKVFGFKKGSYMLYFKQLKEIFPHAKFIHLIRDGRAVFNSKKSSIYSATGKPFETEPCQAAKMWKKKVKLSRHIDSLYPDNSIIIHYEKLITYPNSTLNEVANFLNLNILSSVSSYYYEIPERYGRLHKNIEKQPLMSRIDSWKTSLSSQEIEKYEAIAGKILTLEGYSLCSLFWKRLYQKVNISRIFAIPRKNQ